MLQCYLQHFPNPLPSYMCDICHEDLLALNLRERNSDSIGKLQAKLILRLFDKRGLNRKVIFSGSSQFTFTDVFTDVSTSTRKQVKVNIRSIEEPKIFGSRKFPKILKLRSEIGYGTF